MKNKVTEYIYFVIKCNKDGVCEFVLDSQLKPTMYRDIQQLKKYSYKFKNNKDVKIVIYKIDDVITIDRI